MNIINSDIQNIFQNKSFIFEHLMAKWWSAKQDLYNYEKFLCISFN